MWTWEECEKNISLEYIYFANQLVRLFEDRILFNYTSVTEDNIA
jgi:hypothetical protein